MKLTTERILDEKIDIEIDGHGTFSAEFNDQDYSAPTRKELLEKLQVAIRKARLQGTVPVTVLGLVPVVKKQWSSDGHYDKGAGIVQAMLRARHERQSCWLLVSEEKKKFQVSVYEREGVVIARRLNLAEVTRYLDLREAVRVAEVALEDYVGSVKINPDDALHDATQTLEKAKAK